ncbi:uncharacterized protein V1518DRAFT_417269 [Limtongia smithiae]|uniref:uncharacterized protein n=1 Tax=Limtongia smithiae TaxID=1125753 RepID=UPI0034CF80A0
MHTMQSPTNLPAARPHRLPAATSAATTAAGIFAAYIYARRKLHVSSSTITALALGTAVGRIPVIFMLVFMVILGVVGGVGVVLYTRYSRDQRSALFRRMTVRARTKPVAQQFVAENTGRNNPPRAAYSPAQYPVPTSTPDLARDLLACLASTMPPSVAPAIQCAAALIPQTRRKENVVAGAMFGCLREYMRVLTEEQAEDRASDMESMNEKERTDEVTEMLD